jgi:ABC-type bacteriocin/lantibiotic exporter with double-glycine peptidase domain
MLKRITLRIIFPNQELNQVFSTLSKKEKFHYSLYILFQFINSLLDTSAILLSGLLVSLGYSFSTGVPPSGVSKSILDLPFFRGHDFKFVIATIGVTIVILLGIRTVFSLFVTFRSYNYLASLSASNSSRFMTQIFSSGYSWVKRKSSQELAFLTTQGVENIYVGTLGQYMIYVTDLLFVMLVAFVLLLINPILMFVSMSIFIILGGISHRYSSRRVSSYSEQFSRNTILGNTKVNRLSRLYRESIVSGSQVNLIRDFYEFKKEASANFAKLSWIQIVPKYSVEVVIVIGTFAVTLTSAATMGFSEAMATMTIFLAATSRLAPAALRIQQSLTGINSYIAQSSETLIAMSEVSKIEERDQELQSMKYLEKSDLPPDIEFKDVFFRYDGEPEFILQNINFFIESGDSVAIVGESGVGKSTLCDLILGMLIPNSGIVEIGGSNPRVFEKMNPGKVSFLSQETFLFPGTIRQNVALGKDESEVEDTKIWEALRGAHAADFVELLGGELDFTIDGLTNGLSGGQAQRIGIARALYSNPTLLILDEPTSALDLETERAFVETLSMLKGLATIVVIAHRPETLKTVNKVISLSKDGAKFTKVAE